MDIINDNQSTTNIELASVKIDEKKKRGKRAKGVPKKNAGKKPRRNKSGKVALRQMKKLQNSVELVTQKAPIVRIIREILGELPSGDEVTRLSKKAVNTLHEAAEDYATDFFNEAIGLTIHRKAQELQLKDLKKGVTIVNERMARYK